MGDFPNCHSAAIEQLLPNITAMAAFYATMATFYAAMAAFYTALAALYNAMATYYTAPALCFLDAAKLTFQAAGQTSCRQTKLAAELSFSWTQPPTRSLPLHYQVDTEWETGRNHRIVMKGRCARLPRGSLGGSTDFLCQ